MNNVYNNHTFSYLQWILDLTNLYITNGFLQPGKNYIKMHETEPRFNQSPLNEILVIITTNTIQNLDCKTVGFFFSKSVKKLVKRAVRVLRARPVGPVRREKKRLSPGRALCFQPRSRPFVWLLARTQEYKKFRPVLQSIQNPNPKIYLDITNKCQHMIKKRAKQTNKDKIYAYSSFNQFCFPSLEFLVPYSSVLHHV